MKLTFSHFVVVALFILGLVFLGVSVANAQAIEPPEKLPGTAIEMIGWIQAGLVLLAGLLGNRVTEWISTWNVSWLSKDDHGRARKIALDIIAFGFSIIAGVSLPYVTSVAEYLDTSGLWLIIVAAYPVCRAWFLAQKFSTNIGGLAKLAVVGTAKR